MDLIDEISPLKSNKRFILVRNNSSKSIGSTLSSFSYNKREIMSSRYRPKTPVKGGTLRFKKKEDLILSDRPVYFSNIKNKIVRNFYENVLRSCCKVKEPKERLLKNIFRANNKPTYVLKSKDKNKNNNNNINNLKGEKIETKFRTLNNFPFIPFIRNSGVNSINNSIINNDNEKTNNIKNRKVQLLFSKIQKKNNEYIKQNNIINIYPLSKSIKRYNLLVKNNISKNLLIYSDKDKENKKM